MQDIPYSRDLRTRTIRGVAGLVLASVCGTAVSAMGLPSIFAEKFRPEFQPVAQVNCPVSGSVPRSLIDAAACGDVFRVRARVAEGADVSARDARPGYAGRTALHHAAQRGDVEVVEILLAAGARPDSADAQGNTPLHLLAGRSRMAGESTIGKALINAGADARVRNAARRTALGELLRHARYDIDPLRQSRIPLAVLLDEAEASGPVVARAAAVPAVEAVVRVEAPAAAPSLSAADAGPEASGQAPALAGGAAAKEDGVRAALDSWVSAWSARDVDAYIGHYAADFRPADGSGVDAWRGLRRARLSAAQSIEVRISDLQVSFEGDRAVAQFKQDYRSDSFKSADRKILVLIPEGKGWRIVEEKTAR